MYNTAPEADQTPFQPGSLFAGRYRIVAPLAAGATPDLWRADDLVLQMPVALKVVPAATPEARERLVEEVRVARQITHPAVCRVFDVGQTERDIFYTMELVQGEQLDALLRRAGRITAEKVAEIGRQLCAGLAAAHLNGVIHGGLAMRRVLIDNDGCVRITDFGLSDSDGRASEQTDVQAVGFLLYELLVGSSAFAQARAAGVLGPPSALVPDVPAYLERAIMAAIAAGAPAKGGHDLSAVALAAMLDPLSAAANVSRSQSWIAGAALAALVAIAAILLARYLPRASDPLTDQDVIVIADFMNTTGEPVFDGALKVALAVALEQSPFLKVYPDEGIRDTLRLMQRDPNVSITRQVAREIAQREQAKALVAGSIGRLGSHYVLALEAVNAQTGDAIARDQVEVASKEEVLTALGSASSRLREELGESLASIQQFDAPLPRATTSSLEALHAYSLALVEGRVVPRAEAIPHLRRAIELDPTFALAHALLSGAYANSGRTAEAPAHSRRAFELRDRVSERERFFISWRYYMDALQAWDQALELARSWTATYPREAFAFNSLGLATAAFGQHGEAVTAFRRAIELDARFGPPYSNAIGSLIALNQFAEAGAVIEEAATHGVGSLGIRRSGYLLAFLQGDASGMNRLLDVARTSGDAAWTPSWEARTAVASGRLGAARALYQAAVARALSANMREAAAQWTMEDAEAQAVFEDCAAVSRTVASGLAISRDNFTLERASRALALCGEGAEASSLTGELARRYADATLTINVHVPVTAAAAALHGGNPQRALALLEPVRPYDHAPAAEFWPSYLRGEAFLRLKNGSGAIAEFQGILDQRGKAPTSPLYGLAQLGRARAAALGGDVAAARAAYDTFFAFWSDADDDLVPLRRAREQDARLR